METLKGKYVLERELGHGGMAEVFAGSIQGPGGFSRRIAVKRILPSHCADPTFREMFIEEARLSARLLHSNVVSVIDFDLDESGRLFLVMEFVDGVDLYQLAETHATLGPLPIPVVLFVIHEILAGLAYAHELPASTDGVLGMVHRDVSPQNTLLAWDGHVRVSDFGLAKARAATNASGTLFVKGKPSYMSPEQVNCTELDGRSDLFAVGVMLWELLCGGRLFSRDSVQETFASVLFTLTPPPRTVRSDVPPDVEAVVMSLLEKRREDRFDNADEAIAALAACQDFPKNGRELLATVLAERMPHRAPLRRALARRPVSAPPFPAPGSMGDRAPLRRTLTQSPSIPPGSKVATANGRPPRAFEGPCDDPYKAAAAEVLGARRSRRMVWLSLAMIVIVGAAVGVIVQVTSRETAPQTHPALPLPQERSPLRPSRVAPVTPERSEPASNASATTKDPASQRPMTKNPPAATEPRVRKRGARGDEAESGIREINLDGSPRR